MRSHGSWGNTYDVFLMVLDGEAWDEFNMTEEEAALAEKEKKAKEEAEAEANDKKKDKKGKKKDKKGVKEDEDAKALKFDLANRKYRSRRLTSSSSSVGDYFLSP